MKASPSLKPDDEYNRALLANAHPPDWINPEPASRYNLVVIGAGTAGLVTASAAASLGAKVALVERHLMGGDCLNVGCVPSKALIRASRSAAEVRRADEFGTTIPAGGRVDFPRVMERMRRLRAQISPNDSVDRFRKLGVDVFLADARFEGPSTISADGRRLHFKKAVLATGARAAVPPIPGLAEAGSLTNESVFSLTRLPPRLAVIGGGPIGCEMAQAFARFGSKVHLLEAAPHILMREDGDAAERVQSALAKDAVNLVLGCKILSVERQGDSRKIRLECAGQSGHIEVDEILVGVGRAPNVEGLNLEAAGVEYDSRAGVKVSNRLQTSNPRIYAAGDICSMYKFTHAADAMARIVVQNALFFGRKKASALTIPWCTYTDPEIAHVGLYEREAKERGIPVQTLTVELREIDRAVLDGETEGFSRVHLRAGTDRILGATVVAAHAGEMISEFSLAMTAGVGLAKIAATIHPYPTQSEAIKRLGDAYNRARLTPSLRRWLERYFRWRG
ncbi:MAG: mercuric reductase [Nitrospirae bacterium]|nr:mercuric reductase [Nitrospirota bacterium]